MTYEQRVNRIRCKMSVVQSLIRELNFDFDTLGPEHPGKQKLRDSVSDHISTTARLSELEYVSDREARLRDAVMKHAIELERVIQTPYRVIEIRALLNNLVTALDPIDQEPSNEQGDVNKRSINSTNKNQ